MCRCHPARHHHDIQVVVENALPRREAKKAMNRRVSASTKSTASTRPSWGMGRGIKAAVNKDRKRKAPS
jgi:hypothetical protein